MENGAADGVVACAMLESEKMDCVGVRNEWVLIVADGTLAAIAVQLRCS
jgi:hypothetical protein